MIRAISLALCIGTSACALGVRAARADVPVDQINLSLGSIGDQGSINGIDSTAGVENEIYIQIPALSELTVNLSATGGGIINNLGSSGRSPYLIPTGNGYSTSFTGIHNDNIGYLSFAYLYDSSGNFTKVISPGYIDSYNYSLSSTSTKGIVNFINNQTGGPAVDFITFYATNTINSDSITGDYRVTPINLVNRPGGSVSDPVTLSGSIEATSSGPPGSSGSYSSSYLSAHLGAGSTNNYYSFYWNGGQFSVSALVYNSSGTEELDPSDVFTLALFNANDIPIYSDRLTGCVFQCEAAYSGNLRAGNYTIGVSGYSPTDPELIIYLPASLAAATPEPSTWVMILAGFLGLGSARYRTSRRRMAVGR